jgi:hypothetical protein
MSVTDQLNHLTDLHKIELKALSKSEDITSIINRHFSPCTRLLVLKINESLNVTYPVESAAFVTNAYADILNDINKFNSNGIETNFYDIFMKFLQTAQLHLYSDYAKDFLALLVLAF